MPGAVSEMPGSVTYLVSIIAAFDLEGKNSVVVSVGQLQSQ